LCAVCALSLCCHITANCIIIAPKRLKLRLSGSARKSQKRFRDTPMFKFQAVLARTQPFLSRSVRNGATNPGSNAEKWSIIVQFAVASEDGVPLSEKLTDWSLAPVARCRGRRHTHRCRPPSAERPHAPCGGRPPRGGGQHHCCRRAPTPGKRHRSLF
jgi:hypothetical protein